MTDEKDKLHKKEQRALKKLYGQGYNLEDITRMGNALANKSIKTQKDYRIGKSHVKFGLFGDTHIGNINYDPALMKHAAKTFTKEKVDFVLHTGDVMDGWYQNRPTSLFEQDAIGVDRQMKKSVEELSQIAQPLYFITGNHEYNTFMRGAGIEVGPYLQDRLIQRGLEAHYLGNAEGNIRLKTGAQIKLLHPDGGTAYALSYRIQKIIEGFEGGEKPALLGIGHFHKIEQLFYRNVHAFQSGTLEGQTKFMRGKGIPAHKGFWVLDVYTREGGQIDKLVSQLYPAYQ